MRIDKFLSDSTELSRKEIKKQIKNGMIKCNGKIATDSGMQINTKNDTIELCGKTVKYQKYIYIMMNKPNGYISATYDKHMPVVTDLLKKEFKHFEPFPVGRLDIDTHGLLLLTNDGDLAHKLLSPKTHIPKTYYAETETEIKDEDPIAFESGMDLGDFTTLPAELDISENNRKSAFVTIYEGKFHQIKRMFEHVENKVTYLKRISMGSLKLDETLNEGECRTLSDKELTDLKEILK